MIILICTTSKHVKILHDSNIQRNSCLCKTCIVGSENMLEKHTAVVSQYRRGFWVFEDHVFCRLYSMLDINRELAGRQIPIFLSAIYRFFFFYFFRRTKKYDSNIMFLSLNWSVKVILSTRNFWLYNFVWIILVFWLLFEILVEFAVLGFLSNSLLTCAALHATPYIEYFTY